MLDRTDDISLAADNWLAQFESALAKPGGELKTLFHPDSHWRDVLALSWDVQTFSGADAILSALRAHAGKTRPAGFAIDPDRTAPRTVTRAGTQSIEAIFRFETAQGRGSGMLRLIPDADDDNALKAWTLLTTLDELKGFEEQAGRSRPKGHSYSRDFRGPNWLDLRKFAAEYADRDPVVLVVGGGQAGLSIAARCKQLNLDTLIVDREARVGDNWRNRYHALTLHNQVQVNHLPYMPFPPNWPTYIPKDKLANWFEAYVDAMELNYWTSTEFAGGSYDEAEGRWSVTLRRTDGTTRTMHPKHVVLATGVSGIPNWPDIPSLKNFAGSVLHSSRYDDGENWKGKRAIVIGTGNSGHDIAQDLYSSGANVTLVQRSPTLITNIEPSAQLAYAAYNEGTLEDNDLIATSMPLPLAKKVTSPLPTCRRNWTRTCSMACGARVLSSTTAKTAPAGSSNISPRRRLLLQRRLFGPCHLRRYRAQAVCRYRRIRCGRRTDAQRRDDCRRPDRAGDRLQGPAASGAQPVRR